MTRHDTIKRSLKGTRHGPAFEKHLVELLRAAHAKFGPWISIVDGDLRIEWPGGYAGARRTFTAGEIGANRSEVYSLERRGYIDSDLEVGVGGISGVSHRSRLRLTVEGLRAIGAYPENAGLRHDGRAKKDRVKEAEEREKRSERRLLKAAGCGGRYPSF